MVVVYVKVILDLAKLDSEVCPSAPTSLKHGTEFAEIYIVLSGFSLHPPVLVPLDGMAPTGGATPHRDVLQPVDQLL